MFKTLADKPNDGKRQGRRFFSTAIHLNYGWGGYSDGWFEYESPAKQRKLEHIFSVVPDI